ncbi:phosphatase PAP2 family protein [Deinococcus psychrotolerans]|uniref:Phosphatase PAP2 family protein n=1 Tax=Deinococcus psychrotolerans TaxID=2489213 RepID=A0A3G8Y9A9_9DEIO|nr:phosphatase PAP2 family protein [Deinococcus psychrotolerans]AZI41948.1 phosphatase PAP2 family protein [Deinococcus psychrotolerans]
MNLESFWLLITALGNDLIFIAVLALYGWLVRPSGIRALGVAFALSYLTNSLLKYGLNLPRPFANDPSVASAAAQATAGGPGLPSGHAQMSAALWGGVAAQLRRPWVWAVCLLLVALIAASRLALHVHYPSDVLVGLLLGAIFAGLAGAGLTGRGLFAHTFWWPLALLVVACLLPSSLPDEYSRGLGILAGFWFAAPRYLPPSCWVGRIGVAVIGLLTVLAVYLALGALAGLLPTVLDGPARAIRYFALVWVAIGGVPQLLKIWLRPVEEQHSASQSLPPLGQ